MGAEGYYGEDGGADLELKEKNIVLNDYIKAAMRHAKYEILPDDGSFYGEIPDFAGVFANSANLEDCRKRLEEVLEEWIFFRVSRGLTLPTVDGLDLRIRDVA